MIQLLAGANANAHQADSIGCSPLITASEMGHERSVQVLLQYDPASVNLVDLEV